MDFCFDRHFHGKVIQNLQEMVLRDRGGGNSQQSSWSKDQTMTITIFPTPVLFGGYLVQLEGHVATLVICPNRCETSKTGTFRDNRGFAVARGWGGLRVTSY